MEDDLDAADGVVDALVAAQLALDDLDVSRPARFARLPVEKLSSTRTSSPRSSSARTRFEPMKPAPPVTSTFTLRLSATTW